MTALFAAIALHVFGVVAPSQGDDWGGIWDTLAKLEGMASEAPGSLALAAELRGVADDAAPDPRSLLLRARIETWTSGATPEPLSIALAAESFDAFTSRELWLAVDVLPPGEPRVRAVMRGLATTPNLEQTQLITAWNTGKDEASALRLLRGALPIQQALHERYATDWSTIDLGLTLSRLGLVAETHELYAEAIEQEDALGRPTRDLWAQWGLHTLGFGDESVARDYLGRALARGSKDATLMLGLLDLSAGRLDPARTAFRPSILSDPPAAWALRGWGVSLLPEPQTLPATLR